jgi:hypothetical protein
MAGESPCILHEGARNRNGYGVLPKPVNGSRLAARAVLAEKLGRPVQGVTRHACDNPPCINPDHLIEGTQADNVADTVTRGRQRGGRYTQLACKYGHHLTPDNVRLKPNPTCRSGYERICRKCARRRNSELAARRKAARAAIRAKKETTNVR